MGRKMESSFLETLGQGLYLVVFARLLLLDLPRSYARMPPASRTPAPEYWKGMVDRLWTYGISIASIASAFFLQQREVARNSRYAAPGGDLPQALPRPLGAAALYWFGVLFTFLFLHLELDRMFGYWELMRLPALTVLWCLMASYFLYEYLFRGGRAAPFAAFCVFAGGALLKVFAFDVYSWKLGPDMIYLVPYEAADALARLVDFGAPLLLLALVWRCLLLRREPRVPAPVFGYAALALLFCYATLELHSLLHWKLPAFRAGGISVLWAMFGLAFIVSGIWKNLRALRYAGLALCAIVVGKVFLVDLAHMPTIYKIIALLALGLLLLFGSFAYIYSSRKFTHAEP
jgi:uncharacterized membrane protein